MGLEIWVTIWLRSDQPLACKLQDLFTHPPLVRIVKGRKLAIETADESIDIFIRTNMRVLIIGPPGIGKSTWSKWLQRQVLTERWTGIPVRTDLRRFSTENPSSLHDLIREAAGSHMAEEIDAQRVRRWIDVGQVIFILDGFDEVAPERRDVVRNWILDLHAAVSGCSITLTSRPLTTGHLNNFGEPWQRWDMEPFNTQRIVEYINRWHQNIPLFEDTDRDVDAVRLANAWQADPTIGPLTGNPLLLSTLLMVHHLDGRLPSGRSQLYRRYVEGMLGLWDDRRKVSATNLHFSLEQKRQVLRGLALHIHLQEKDELDEQATIAMVTKLIETMSISLPATNILDILRERSGLLVGPGIYNFVHKSVAEYLVAEAVEQGDQRDASGHRIDRFRLFKHRDDDRWNTVIFLWAGLAPVVEVEAFIDECWRANDLSLAYGILNDQFEQIPAETQQRYLRYLVDQSSLFEPSAEFHAWWGFARPAHLTNGMLPNPQYQLRGLRNTSLENWLEQNISKYKINWADVAAADGVIRDLLWISFAQFSFETITEWKACLADLPPSHMNKVSVGSSGNYPSLEIESWCTWAATALFQVSLFKKAVPEASVIAAAYREARPEFAGTIPFLLMESLKAVVAGEFSYRHMMIDRITNLLEILPTIANEWLDTKWLRGTTHWYPSSSFQANDEQLDLLSEFIDVLNKLIADGVLLNNSCFECTVSFVEKLREQRGHL